MKFVPKLLGAALAVALFTPALTFAQKAEKAKDAVVKDAPAKAKVAANAPTGKEIADAKAKGLVWVNTNSGIWHTSGDRYFGKTKEGQFMTTADATKAGYRAEKENAVEKKASEKKDASTAATDDSGSKKKKKNYTKKTNS